MPSLHFSKVHIFLARSPFHIFIVKRIIDFFINDQERVIIFYEGGDIEWPGRPGHVEFNRLQSYSKSRGAWNIVTGNVGCIHRRLAELNCSMSFYLTDIRWPTNNQIYFGMRKSGSEFSFYAEGMASYIDRSDRFKLAVNAFAKFFLSKVRLAAPYRPFISDNLGYSMPGFKALYAPQVHRIMTSAHRVEIPLVFEPKARLERDDSLLFLGQPLEQKISSEAELRVVLGSTVEKIKNLGYKDLYYKPHPYEGGFPSRFFVEHGFKLIQPEGIFEEWVGEQWQGRALASYFSTALLTAGMLISVSEVSLISVNFDSVAGLYLNPKDKEKLRSSLSLFNCDFV